MAMANGLVSGERMERGARIAGAVTAVVAWAAAALQLWLIVDKIGLGPGLWRFLGFFTLLTNIGVATVATGVALGWPRIGGPRARLLAATSIVMVGLTYSIALRSIWNPTGLQKLTDFALHDLTPLMFMAVWILAPNGSLGRRDFAWALVPPALYAAYAMVRGAMDGWYAYWFLDPGQQAPLELVASIAILIGGFAVIAALLLLLDRWLGRIEDEAEAGAAA
jgi:hypothetical protein